MTLYLDTEFNGFGGQLISIALVSDESAEEFYGVLPLPSKVHPWVAEHVVPYLVADAEPHYKLRHRLFNYLKRHEGQVIIADWPEDLAHLLGLMCEPGGMQFDIDLHMSRIESGKLTPDMPHNALSDARALRDWAVSTRRVSKAV